MARCDHVEHRDSGVWRCRREAHRAEPIQPQSGEGPHEIPAHFMVNSDRESLDD